jgi:bifunctional DNase/RNase
MIEVNVKNILFYAKADVPGYTIFLQSDEDDSKSLPIVVGQYEAQSIALALEQIKLNRPMTHDLLMTIIQELTYGLERVTISDMEEGTYYARLHIRTDDRVEQIDARPSDAIALALRMRAPIHVEEKLFKQSAVATPNMNESEADSRVDLHENVEEITRQAEKRFGLEKDLREAVSEEDYEKAARIRDKLDGLSDTN